MTQWQVLYPRRRGVWPATTIAVDGSPGYGMYDPATRRLRAIRPDEDTALPGLARWLPRADLVSYRPGRRATLRAQSGGVVRYVKVVRPSRAPGIVRRHRAAAAALRSHRSVRVPELVVSQPDEGVVVLSALPGPALHHRLRAGDGPGWTGVAQGLAALHRAPVAGLETAAAEDLAGWHGWVQQHSTDRALLQELAGAAAVLPPPAPSPRRPIHGDLHDKNIILLSRGVGLIDLDGLHRGVPATDVGNLAGHLVLRHLQVGRPVAGGERAAGLLVGAYRAAGGPASEPDVVAAGARTLFRLACVYFFRRRWQHLAPSLAAVARSWGAAAAGGAEAWATVA